MLDRIMSSLNQNSLFFSMLYYILAEQQNIDWAIKSSMLTMSGLSDHLEQEAILEENKIENIVKYLQTAKPFHTYFAGMIEQYASKQDAFAATIKDDIDFDIIILFDRITKDKTIGEYSLGGFDSMPFGYVDPDSLKYENSFGFDSVVSIKKWPDEALENAANRVYAKFEDNITQEQARQYINAEFKALKVDGGTPIDLDKSGFDVFNFDINQYDFLTYDRQYYITSNKESVISFREEEDNYSKKEFISSGTKTFEIPEAPFEVSKILVDYRDHYGNQRRIRDYIQNGKNITLDFVPEDDSIIIISVVDFEYLYDKLYINNRGWKNINTEVQLDGTGLINPIISDSAPESIPLQLSDGLTFEIDVAESSIEADASGFDAAAFDTTMFDLDTGNKSNENISLAPESSYDRISTLNVNGKELGTYPQSVNAIMYFHDGKLSSNYSINWDQKYRNTYIDANHKLNPQIIPTNISNNDTVFSFGVGGTAILYKKVYYNISEVEFDIDVGLTDTNTTFVSVDGILAEISLITSTRIKIENITPINSTIMIVVYKDNNYSRVYKQDFNDNTVFELTNPSSGYEYPAQYFSTFVFDQVTGIKLNPIYSKIYYVNDKATSRFKLYLPDNLDDLKIKVYISESREMATWSKMSSFVISGDYLITNIQIAVGNLILITYEDNSVDYTLENDGKEIHTKDTKSLTVYTVNSDLSIGMRTETIYGKENEVIPLGDIPYDYNNLMVFANGNITSNYIVEDDGLRIIGLQTGDIIQFIYSIFTPMLPTIGLRFCVDDFGNSNYYKKSVKYSCILSEDLEATADEIFVDNASALISPYIDNLNVRNCTPGRIFIDDECIEFYGIDTSVSPNRLYKLRRGRKGTSITNHIAGATVYDSSDNQLLVQTVYKNAESRTTYYRQIGNWNQSYVIKGHINNNSEVNCWILPLTKVISGIKMDDTKIVVDRIDSITIPGDSTIDGTPGVLIETTTPQDELRFFFDEYHSFNYAYSSSKLEDEIAAINDNSVMKEMGAKIEILRSGFPQYANYFHMSIPYGMNCIIRNNAGYALQELFGGAGFGNNKPQAIHATGHDGLKVNGVEIIFNKIGTQNVLKSLNDNMTLTNAYFRQKNGYIEVISLDNKRVTIENITGHSKNLEVGDILGKIYDYSIDFDKEELADLVNTMAAGSTLDVIKSIDKTGKKNIIQFSRTASVLIIRVGYQNLNDGSYTWNYTDIITSNETYHLTYDHLNNFGEIEEINDNVHPFFNVTEYDNVALLGLPSIINGSSTVKYNNDINTLEIKSIKSEKTGTLKIKNNTLNFDEIEFIENNDNATSYRLHLTEPVSNEEVLLAPNSYIQSVKYIKQEYGVDYTIKESVLTFNRLLPEGTVVRIQNRAKTGTVVVGNNLQYGTNKVSKKLNS